MIQHPAHHPAPWSKLRRVGVATGNVQKIGVEVIDQPRAHVTRMGRQGIRRREIGNRMPLGDDDSGLMIED